MFVSTALAAPSINVDVVQLGDNSTLVQIDVQADVDVGGASVRQGRETKLAEEVAAPGGLGDADGLEVLGDEGQELRVAEEVLGTCQWSRTREDMFGGSSLQRLQRDPVPPLEDM